MRRSYVKCLCAVYSAGGGNLSWSPCLASYPTVSTPSLFKKKASNHRIPQSRVTQLVPDQPARKLHPRTRAMATLHPSLVCVQERLPNLSPSLPSSGKTPGGLVSGPTVTMWWVCTDHHYVPQTVGVRTCVGDVESGLVLQVPVEGLATPPVRNWRSSDPYLEIFWALPAAIMPSSRNGLHWLPGVPNGSDATWSTTGWGGFSCV